MYVCGRYQCAKLVRECVCVCVCACVCVCVCVYMLWIQVIEILWTKRKYFLSSKYVNQLDGSDLDIGHVELDKEKAKAAEQVILFRTPPPPSVTPALLSPTRCDSNLKVHKNTYEYA